MSTSTENLLEVALDAVALHIKLEEADGTLSLIIGTAYHRTIVYDVALAVVIEEETWVDTIYLWQVDRLAPALGWVFRLYEEVASAHIGGDHIESLVLLVVVDGRCEDTTRYVLSLQWHL